MIPILKQKNEKTILTKDITEKHLIVAVINGSPAILGKEIGDYMDKSAFFLLYSKTSSIITGGGQLWK